MNLKDCLYLYKAKVLKVIDGDTYKVIIDLGLNTYKIEKIRLKDFDTPETFRPRNLKEKEEGMKAKELVKNLIEGKEVYIKTYKDKTGKYGRLLADVQYIDEKDESLKSIIETLRERKLYKKKQY